MSAFSPLSFRPSAAILLLLLVASPGCRSRARNAPAPAPTGTACRPLEPDEEIVPELGTTFVIRSHTRMAQSNDESTSILRWTVVSIVGKKVMARAQATVGNYTGPPSEPVELVFGGALLGKGNLEIVAVPAGRFRCRRTVSNTGDAQVESWTAKGIPGGVQVRQVIRTSKLTSTSELIRIESAAIAPPPPPEAPPPPVTRVEENDEVVLTLGTCFVSEMTMSTASFDLLTVTRVTVVALDDRKATLRTVAKTGGSETETTHDMPIFAQPPLEDPVEIVDVPAGRFRCQKSSSKSTNTAGTFVTDVWMARGIPAAVRSTTNGPDMVMETKLVRIENVKLRKPAPPQGETFVLVVGVNEVADASLPALRLAEADARAVGEFFANANRSPTTAERVRVLEGKSATRVAILKAIREHLTGKNVREQDSIVLYFSGYAFSDADEAYLLGSDAQMDALPETAISATSLAGYWDQIRARRKVLITDACRKDGPDKLKGGFSIRGATETAGKPWAGTLLLSSSESGQFAVEAEGAGPGIFAAAFLEGLGGNADADRDGKVSGEEISNYVVREVPSRSGGRQTPVGRTEGCPPLLLTR